MSSAEANRWVVFSEQEKDYLAMYKFLFEEEPKYFLYHKWDFQEELAIAMQGCVNSFNAPLFSGEHGVSAAHLYELADYMGRTTVGKFYESMMSGGIPYILAEIDDYIKNDSISPMGVLGIGHNTAGNKHQQFVIGGTLPMSLRMDIMSSHYGTVLKTLVATECCHAARIATDKPPKSIRIDVNAPMVPGGGMMPLLKPFKDAQWYPALVTMLRSSAGMPVINRLDHPSHPYTVHELKAADLIYMKHEHILMLADLFKYFRMARFQSHTWTTSDKPQEERIKDARFYMTRALMAPDIHIWLIFKPGDSNPAGILEYKAAKDQPILLNKFLIREDLRGKGIGSWVLDYFLSTIYANPDTIPVQIVDVFGRDLDKVSKFYASRNFKQVSADMELALNTDQILELRKAIGL